MGSCAVAAVTVLSLHEGSNVLVAAVLAGLMEGHGVWVGEESKQAAQRLQCVGALGFVHLSSGYVAS